MVSDAQIPYFADRGLVTVAWSIDSYDWVKGRNSTEQIVANVMNNVHEGAIVLFHSNRLKQTTFAALPTIITELKARGYELRTVPDLLKLGSVQ
jgi:peptidoglycan/xylan/chitin deacetylase (PgdA/CDA1 family)